MSNQLVTHNGQVMTRSEMLTMRWTDPVQRAALSKKAKGRPHLDQRKFTDEEVREIRQRYANGESQTYLSRIYGCSQPIVSYIIRRVTYAEVL